MAPIFIRRIAGVGGAEHVFETTVDRSTAGELSVETLRTRHFRGQDRFESGLNRQIGHAPSLAPMCGKALVGKVHIGLLEADHFPCAHPS